MASYNRVVLVGNLTRDVELKYLQSGMAVAEVGLAINDRRKSATGEWVDDPVFVDITFWGRTAEIAAEYLGKGSSMLVEGRLKYDSWEKEGKKFSKLRVVGERMQMLGQKAGGGGNRASGASAPPDEASYAAAVNGEFNSPPPRGRGGAGMGSMAGGAGPDVGGPTGFDGPPADDVPF
ncbi:MAG: single-stranded DNA-binding protein [Planctomycetota bacterium]